jgi:hypothetical protein
LPVAGGTITGTHKEMARAQQEEVLVLSRSAPFVQLPDTILDLA